jgi:F-box-like
VRSINYGDLFPSEMRHKINPELKNGSHNILPLHKLGVVSIMAEGLDTEGKRRSAFLRLPFEIALSIISQLDLDNPVVSFTDKDDTSYKMTQLMALRLVSKRFSDLVGQHLLWHERDSDFASLVPLFSETDGERGVRILKLFEVLFADPEIGAALQARKAWTISKLYTLFAMMRYLPRLNNISRITLSVPGVLNETNAMEQLGPSLCPHLTYLNLSVNRNFHAPFIRFDMGVIESIGRRHSKS